MYGHFNLPPFGINEKTRIKIKGNRMFATTTSRVMVKNQPVIHLSVGTVMRLAICNHAQRIEINNKARQSNKQNQIIKQKTITSQMFTNIVGKIVFREAGRLKT